MLELRVRKQGGEKDAQLIYVVCVATSNFTHVYSSCVVFEQNMIS